MFDLRKIPVLRALIPFMSGVVVGTLISPDIQSEGIWLVSLFLWLTALLFFLWQGRKPGPGLWLFSMAMALLFCFTGMGAAMLTRPADPGLPVDQWVLIRGEIEDEPRAGKNSYAFDMELHFLCAGDRISYIKTRLRGHCRMPADSIMPSAGEIWQFSGKLVSIRNSGNPGDPDYRSIMGRKNCWYHFYPSAGQSAARSYRKISGKGRGLSPVLLRRKVSAHWHGREEEVSLLKAVCLGDRSSLSDEMRQVYASAGGMHLLAVSGLHVGLIWWVLQHMTGWMRLIFRDEKQRTAGVVGLLWFYAFLTGFSSSVCRSVTMFTFFSAGSLMGQRVHPLNAILVSAFILLLIDPHRLMDVGFQLSYSAIIGIVCLHPVFRKMIRVKYLVLRRIWEAFSLSLAAQLSTAPLVIFYFHQLPLYSILTSLFAVPLLSVLIAIFVCSVPFVSAGILEGFFSFLLVGLARLMNRTMECLSSLPGAVLDDLQLDAFSLCLCILFLLLLMISLHARSRLPRYLLSSVISIILIWNAFQVLRRQISSELVISHFKGASMLSIRHGSMVDHYCWYVDSTSMPYMEQYRDVRYSRRIYQNQVLEVENNRLVSGRSSSCLAVDEGVWMLGTQHIRGLVLSGDLKDRSGWQPGKPDFILLSGEPPPGHLPHKKYLQNTELVLDGSNRSWYKKRLIPEVDSFHLTDSSGAFVKRW